MSAHTPGPWNITPMGGQAVSPRDGFFVSADDSLGVRTDIAVVRSCPTHQLGELQANARLIAAAPELLEVLRWCAETAPRAYHSHGADVVVDEIIRAARAAIAKAEGR